MKTGGNKRCSGKSSGIARGGGGEELAGVAAKANNGGIIKSASRRMWRHGVQSMAAAKRHQ
jgi:hypothetical protein